ncbi:MAG: hypothetical protein MRECE_2c119 [Mycoplasmataceae bacterium CE_OT135]|nr:MAG: hypothetical protein MRECE_2c119 [Mycoplasmataceae bacterium CE_OT135]
MTNQFNPAEIKQKLGEQTQKLEAKASELWSEFNPNYTNLEPWQRGLILIGIVILLIFTAYYLTHESQSKTAIRKAQAEAAIEDKIIRKMELLKKLRE